MAKLPKLNPWALGGAAMVTNTFYIILLGVTSAFGWGTQMMNAFSSIYIGYNSTLLGIIIGALWAALDGFVLGLIVAVSYNWAISWCPLIKK